MALGLVMLLATSVEAQYRGPAPRYHRPMHNYSTTRQRAPRGLELERNSLKLHVMGEIGMADIASVFYHDGISHFGAGVMLEYQPACIFSVGLGANFDAGSNCRRPCFDEFMYSVPIYANFRLSTPGRMRFFVEGRLGGALPLYITNADYSAKGLYTGAGMGFSLCRSNISVGVNVTDLYPNCEGTRHYGNDKDILAEFYLRYSYAFKLR